MPATNKSDTILIYTNDDNLYKQFYKSITTCVDNLPETPQKEFNINVQVENLNITLTFARLYLPLEPRRSHSSTFIGLASIDNKDFNSIVAEIDSKVTGMGSGNNFIVGVSSDNNVDAALIKHNLEVVKSYCYKNSMPNYYYNPVDLRLPQSTHDFLIAIINAFLRQWNRQDPAVPGIAPRSLELTGSITHPENIADETAPIVRTAPGLRPF